MRDWFLTQDDPLALRIAADTRLTPTDYADDQSWELALSGGEPPALSVRTTYGLRARELRLFPIFSEGDQHISDPAAFAVRPTLRSFFVNHLRVECEPLPGVKVTAHYWVAESHVLAGQFTLVNRDAERPNRTISVAVAGLLKPITGGEGAAAARGATPLNRPLGPSQREEYAVLEGQTGNLNVIVAMDEEARGDSAPHPVLTRTIELPFEEPVVVRWACAARPSAAESLVLLREVFAREWEGEFARLELLNESLLEIETGDRDWDAAFAFAQNVSLRCFVGPTDKLPHPSFVFSRNPDRGYSRKGDGSDHPWLWDGQVATEAYVALPNITHAAPELAKGILLNWLAVQDERGFIDWKPGLAGQRNKALCIPLLASLCWKIYQDTQDLAFLDQCYLGLYRFFNVWFSSRYDRDGDGVPEWSHTIQSAFDDNPSFVRWQKWGQGADVTAVESPDLASYLYREATALLQIREALGRPEEPEITARAAALKAVVDAMWRDETAIYHYIDRDSHAVTRGEVLAIGRGDLAVDLARRFDPAARIVVRAVGPAEQKVALGVTVAGRGPRGRHRVEAFKRSQAQWYFGVATATSDKLYAEVERVEVTGLTDDYEVVVSTVDTTRQDQTLLLPLWAGLPDAARAEALVRRTVLDPERFWRANGLPNCAANEPVYRADNRGGSGGVWMMWNTMVCEGLIDYGYRVEAAELIARLMHAMIHGLRTDHAFSEAYNADVLDGLGEKDYLWGVAPVHLMLRAAGIRPITPRRVVIDGFCPFPWPVTVRWKGLEITRSGTQTSIHFPSEAIVTLDDTEPHVVDDPGPPDVTEEDE
ncbi:MAG: hypothetical protein JNL73_08885 [Anaerolineales bacterium]|nr:hypothetical protein [Anaerolineales bacterium]